MTRLNGWYRLGIASTVLWLVGATLWFNFIILSDAQSAGQIRAQTCIDAKAQRNDFDFSSCYRDFSDSYAQAIDGHWLISIGVAAACAATAWIIMMMLVFTIRWIRAGGFR